MFPQTLPLENSYHSVDKISTLPVIETWRLCSKQWQLWSDLHALHARGVQIRSETDPIHSDFGTKIFILDRIDKVVIQNKMN